MTPSHYWQAFFWINAAVIPPGHAALKKGKEHDQEKAAFLAVANNLGWRLTENEEKRDSGKRKRQEILTFLQFRWI